MLSHIHSILFKTLLGESIKCTLNKMHAASLAISPGLPFLPFPLPAKDCPACCCYSESLMMPRSSLTEVLPDLHCAASFLFRNILKRPSLTTSQETDPVTKHHITLPYFHNGNLHHWKLCFVLVYNSLFSLSTMRVQWHEDLMLFRLQCLKYTSDDRHKHLSKNECN